MKCPPTPLSHSHAFGKSGGEESKAYRIRLDSGTEIPKIEF